LDEKLYERYDPGVLSGGNSDSDHSIEFVYITFRSMIAKEKAFQLFKNAKAMKSEHMQFDNHYLKIITPTSPS
jgi:hypothetical protein